MAGKPVVLPEVYSGEGSILDWIDHFEGVAAVNEWQDKQKLLWLRARLTGRALTTYKKFSEAVRGDFAAATDALKARFEPASKQELYRAELHSRRRKKGEDWADLGQDLRTLADKAYPGLGENARQQLALQQFLSQIENAQVAFGVKQRHPSTVEEAVGATLELESYLMTPRVKAVSQVSSEREDALMDMLAQLMRRMDKLEATTPASLSERSRPPVKTQSSQDRQRERQVICHKCGQPGHFAKGCAAQTSTPQGNSTTLERRATHQGRPGKRPNA